MDPEEIEALDLEIAHFIGRGDPDRVAAGYEQPDVCLGPRRPGARVNHLPDEGRGTGDVGHRARNAIDSDAVLEGEDWRVGSAKEADTILGVVHRAGVQQLLQPDAERPGPRPGLSRGDNVDPLFAPVLRRTCRWLHAVLR